MTEAKYWQIKYVNDEVQHWWINSAETLSEHRDKNVWLSLFHYVHILNISLENPDSAMKLGNQVPFTNLSFTKGRGKYL